MIQLAVEDIEEEGQRRRSRLRSERLALARELGRHTDREWIELCQHHGYRCAKCNSEERLVKDHILPIYAGGSDGINNIQPLCTRCNSSKGPDRTDYRKPVPA